MRPEKAYNFTLKAVRTYLYKSDNSLINSDLFHKCVYKLLKKALISHSIDFNEDSFGLCVKWEGFMPSVMGYNDVMYISDRYKNNPYRLYDLLYTGMHSEFKCEENNLHEPKL